MFFVYEIDHKLIARVAVKAGLSEEDAKKILKALEAVAAEDEKQRPVPTRSDLAFHLSKQYDALPGESPSHVLSLPVIEREDGSIIVDRDNYSVLTWLKKPITTPKIRKPQPIDPPEPGYPVGSYPGPSVSIIKVNDWLGKDLVLGPTALGKFRNAFGPKGGSKEL
jgi:hypothetical protein